MLLKTHCPGLILWSHPAQGAQKVTAGPWAQEAESWAYIIGSSNGHCTAMDLQ